MRRYKTAAEIEAFRDGWNTAGNGGHQHERPNYLTRKERDAFAVGWDERAERIALGYRDNDLPISNSDATRATPGRRGDPLDTSVIG